MFILLFFLKKNIHSVVYTELIKLKIFLCACYRLHNRNYCYKFPKYKQHHVTYLYWFKIYNKFHIQFKVVLLLLKLNSSTVLNI